MKISMEMIGVDFLKIAQIPIGNDTYGEKRPQTNFHSNME